MKTFQSKTVLLGTLLLSVPFLVKLSLIIDITICILGAQLLYYGAVAHTDMFYALYRKNFGKMQKLGASREDLYRSCLRTFENMSFTDNFLFAYAMSPSKTKNNLFVGFIALSVAVSAYPFEPVEVLEVEMTQVVSERLPVPKICENTELINGALSSVSKLFKPDTLNYYVIFGNYCSCGYCVPSDFIYGQHLEDETLGMVFVGDKEFDIRVIVDMQTGFVKYIEQSIIANGKIQDVLLYVSPEYTMGTNSYANSVLGLEVPKSLDDVKLQK